MMVLDGEQVLVYCEMSSARLEGRRGAYNKQQYLLLLYIWWFVEYIPPLNCFIGSCLSSVDVQEEDENE